ncbi:hypothetical protein CPC08DRAFT_725121 [Agrocybe pediades]|nr:hypothetical protein CPC08DRAFT_725121 [Agrocybe pediades]
MITVNLVWMYRWSIVKVLFLANRDIFCWRPFTSFQTEGTNIDRLNIIAALLSSLLTEAILQIRVYALYYQANRTKVLWFMLSCFTVTSAVSGWLLSVDLSSSNSQAVQIVPGTVTCAFPMLPAQAFAFWVPSNVYDTILCYGNCSRVLGEGTPKRDDPRFSPGIYLSYHGLPGLNDPVDQAARENGFAFFSMST